MTLSDNFGLLFAGLSILGVVIFGVIYGYKEQKEWEKEQVLKEYIKSRNEKLGIQSPENTSELEKFQNQLKKDHATKSAHNENMHKGGQESNFVETILFEIEKDNRGVVEKEKGESTTDFPTRQLLASFWLRFGAFLVDALIVFGFVFFIFLLAGLIISALSLDIDIDNGKISLLGVYYIYCASMESSNLHATLGKRAFGVYVVSQNGERISRRQAYLRNFAKILSYITLGIGFLMCIWTKEKQALHDKIAKTLVCKS